MRSFLTRQYPLSHPLSRRKTPLHALKNAYNSQYHLFHSTTKREILPLIAVGMVAVIGRYSYKAIVRMEDEREDYEEELKKYYLRNPLEEEEENENDQHRSNRSSPSASKKIAFRGGFLGVDLGSVNLRVAHSEARSGKAKILEDREGGRSTPAYYQKDDNDGVESLLGRLAKAKLYERSGSVSSPRNNVIHDNGTASDLEAIQRLVTSAARNGLEQILGDTRTGSVSSETLFSIDESSQGGYNVRPVFTHPGKDIPSSYPDTISKLVNPPTMALFVPESVAALRAAREYKVLTPTQTGPVLIVDVGGEALTLTIVNPDQTISHHTTLPHPFGGDVLQNALVTHLSRDFYREQEPDSMALQRMHDAAEYAVLELSTKSRSQINIPYLSMDYQTMQPRHLERGISRDVLKEEVNSYIVRQISGEGVEYRSYLSTGLPPPKDLTTFLSSVFMKVLEESKVNPFQLENVLVLGGAARSPIWKNAIGDGFAKIAGDPFVKEKMIVPDGEMVEELVVMGAALSGGDGFE